MYGFTAALFGDYDVWERDHIPSLKSNEQPLERRMLLPWCPLIITILIIPVSALIYSASKGECGRLPGYI